MVLYFKVSLTEFVSCAGRDTKTVLRRPNVGRRVRAPNLAPVPSAGGARQRGPVRAAARAARAGRPRAGLGRIVALRPQILGETVAGAVFVRARRGLRGGGVGGARAHAAFAYVLPRIVDGVRGMPARPPRAADEAGAGRAAARVAGRRDLHGRVVDGLAERPVG